MNNQPFHIVRRFQPEPIETSSRSKRRHASEISEISAETAPSEVQALNGDNIQRSRLREIVFQNSQSNDSSQRELGRRNGLCSPPPTAVAPRSSPNHATVSKAESENQTVENSSPDIIRRYGATSQDVNQYPIYRPLSQVLETTSKCPLPYPIKGPPIQEISPQKESSRHGRGGKSVRQSRTEPIESVKRSRRQGLDGSEHSDSEDLVKMQDLSEASSPSRLSRKFTPQLIETGKRSFRKSDLRETFAVDDDEIHVPMCTSRPSGRNVFHTLHGQSINYEPLVSEPPESQFSYTSLVRRQDRKRHSFRVPDLPVIPSNSSDGSGGSDVPSLSTSPSTSSDESAKRLRIKDQFRESCDERFSGYILSLAARSAEKQLRDQALAAFPNEQVHQPVSHFAIDREDEDDSDDEDQNARVAERSDIEHDMVQFKRESTADLPWELERMRRHKEAQLRGRKGQSIDDQESRFSAAAIAARQGASKANPPPNTSFLGGWQKDMGLAQMRHASSPPMLGDDLVFPFSMSPQATRCENDQALIFHSELEGSEDGRSIGLWSANHNLEDENAAGLWMGLCQKDEAMELSAAKRSRYGIVTPTSDIEGDSYLSLDRVALSDPNTEFLITPPDSEYHHDHLDNILDLEKDIEQEFHNGFVTQVYNYLSLGYPSLAHFFDHELSKISGIPVEDLRRDDLCTDAKGFVGAPEGAGVNEGVTGGKCMRWTALRLYIREWARQQPQMMGNDNNLDAWGVRERRGSWAI